jgi:hypothetical protein
MHDDNDHDDNHDDDSRAVYRDMRLHLRHEPLGVQQRDVRWRMRGELQRHRRRHLRQRYDGCSLHLTILATVAKTLVSR